MKGDRRGTIEGFADRLDDLICKSGLTCSQIGERVGRERKSIYAYKNGDCSPDIVVLARLCTVLHTTPNYLIYGKD